MERRGVSQGDPKAYFGKEMSEEVNARLAIRWSVPGLNEPRVRVVEFKTGCEKANSRTPLSKSHLSALTDRFSPLIRMVVSRIL